MTRKPYINKILKNIDNDKNVDQFIEDRTGIDISTAKGEGKNFIYSIKLGVMCFFLEGRIADIVRGWTDGELDSEDVFPDFFQVLTEKGDYLVIRGELSYEITTVPKSILPGIRKGDYIHGIAYIKEEGSDLELYLIEELYFKLTDTEIDYVLAEEYDYYDDYLEMLFSAIVMPRILGDSVEKMAILLNDVINNQLSKMFGSEELTDSADIVDNHIKRILGIPHYLLSIKQEPDVFDMDYKDYLIYTIENNMYFYKGELESYIEFLSDALSSEMVESKEVLEQLADIKQNIFSYKAMQKDKPLINQLSSSKLVGEIPLEIDLLIYYYGLFLDMEYIEVTPKTKKISARHKRNMMKISGGPVLDNSKDDFLIETFKAYIISSKLGYYADDKTIVPAESNILYVSMEWEDKMAHIFETVMSVDFWMEILPKSKQKYSQDIIKGIKKYVISKDYSAFDGVEGSEYADRVMLGTGIIDDINTMTLGAAGEMFRRYLDPESGDAKVLDINQFR